MSLKVTVISASTRSNSQSLRVSKYLQKVLDKNDVSTHLLDLNQLKLPVYDASGEGDWKQDWQSVSKDLDNSDGFVVVSPEWDGMASVGWLNMLHYVNRELAHKPLMLVAVSSGMGGAYPIAQMKEMGQKNKHFVLVPENLRFSNVKDLFDEEGSEIIVESVKARSEYALKLLIEYAKVIKPIRSSNIIDFDSFGNGV